ncbi:hypothetical protein BGW80DRAFT_809551 [Lactifluus volemus]|nr:hypothetical protein BGW80DRAFT_809551 [Lactifluus volemus]
MSVGVCYTRAGMLASTSSCARHHIFSFLCMSGSSTHSLQPGNTVAHKKRAAVFHPRATYTFQIYLAYAPYPSLYIARP